MAQNKMDKDFSKKLNEREIQPSPMAWDRLDAMLSVAEEKKPAKRYNWIYIAAGFLGFLFIGIMLFNQTQEMTDAGNNELVIEENTVKGAAESSPSLETIKPIHEKVQNTAVASEEKAKVGSAEKANQNKREVMLQKRQENVIADNQNKRELLENRKQDLASNNQVSSQSIITRADANGRSNQKTEQVKNTTYVNVDELLASVEKAPKPSKPTVKVDANDLLAQVDGELELSFREKVIQTVSKQYKNVKVALSNRNVQN